MHSEISRNSILVPVHTWYPQCCDLDQRHHRIFQNSSTVACYFCLYENFLVIANDIRQNNSPSLFILIKTSKLIHRLQTLKNMDENQLELIQKTATVCMFFINSQLTCIDIDKLENNKEILFILSSRNSWFTYVQYVYGITSLILLLNNMILCLT